MKWLNCLLWLLPTIGAAAFSDAAPRKIETTVEKATLFIEGAQVVRSRRIDLPAGASTLLFTGLSPYLDEKSVQVAAKGKFTVTSVNRLVNRTDSLERSTRGRQIEQELRKIEKRQQQIRDERQVIEARYEVLKINCSQGNRNVAPTLAAIRELNDYYARSLQEMKRSETALNDEALALQERADRLLGELRQQEGRATAPMSEIEVTIEAPTPCEGSFTLSYYVQNAGWFPSYDVRSDGLTEPLNISYKAHIHQNTQENWENVRLTLSSSNPTTGNIVPQLATYWLDYGLSAPRYEPGQSGLTVSGTICDAERVPLPGASVSVPGTTVGTIADAEGRYSVTLPEGASRLRFAYVGFLPCTMPVTGNRLNVVLEQNDRSMAETVVTAYGMQSRNGAAAESDIAAEELAVEEESAAMEVERTQNRLGYEFEIKQPYTVPSGGKAVVAEIGRFSLPARYSYRCVPRIEKDAFLVAEAVDWESFNLLEGEASVYFENTFVGKSILDPARASDTLRFSLGRDRGIRVERTKADDYLSRRAIGSNRTQSMAWKFAVRNVRAEPVVLMLTDQIPVSRNSTIQVVGEELSGGVLDPDSGFVEWNLQLAPGEQRELLLRYSVKYPKGQHLSVE